MNKKRNSKNGGGPFSCKSEVCQALKIHKINNYEQGYEHCTPTKSSLEKRKDKLNEGVKAISTSYQKSKDKLNEGVKAISTSYQKSFEKMKDITITSSNKFFKRSEEKKKQVIMDAISLMNIDDEQYKNNLYTVLNTIIDLFKDKDKDKDKKLPDVLEKSDTSKLPQLILYKYEIRKGEKKLTPAYHKKRKEYDDKKEEYASANRVANNAVQSMARPPHPPIGEFLCKEKENLTYIYLPVIKSKTDEYIDLLKHSRLRDEPISVDNLINKSSFEGDQIEFTGSVHARSFPFQIEKWNEKNTIRLKRVNSLTYDISTQDNVNKLILALSQGTAAVGGKKHSKKEILGKSICIYKIKGDRKEYVKHKGKLITVKEYKAMIKAKAKKPKKQPKQKVQKKST